ncbi:MAG TPA: HD domain-containing phosphohydrolase, partial [Longimicrobiales bacterium]|nr:HD domain-containing phosphohydrolase [Longimicrobiales bacterium]
MADPASIRVQEQGRKLLTAFYGALRALKLYPLENAAVQQALAELHTLVDDVVRAEGGAELRIVGDFFFLNETRLRLDITNFSTFGSFARTLADHGIGAVEVLRGVRPDEWAPFLSLLVRKPGEEDPFTAFVERLNDTPTEHLDVRREQDVSELELEEEEALAAAKRTYAQSVKVARDVLSDVRLGRAVNVRKVKRAVQSIVDRVLANESSMITMTTLKDFDEYTFTHCVNVCIFSVVIGQRLGLSKIQLYELGLGGLLHDIGKMRIAPEVINKPEGLDDEEWAQLKEHPTEGLLLLFQMGGFADMPYRQMLMAYEHHMKIDVSGYPSNTRPRDPTLFSRIVAVADGFDAGTSIRSY